MKAKITGELIKKVNATATVSVTRLRRHRLYGKQYRITKKFYASNPKDIGKVGDTVEITETRPISKNIRWNLEKVVKES